LKAYLINTINEWVLPVNPVKKQTRIFNNTRRSFNRLILPNSHKISKPRPLPIQNESVRVDTKHSANNMTGQAKGAMFFSYLRAFRGQCLTLSD